MLVIGYWVVSCLLTSDGDIMMSLVCGHNHAMYPIWRLTNDDDSALNWSLELDLSLAQFISDIRKVRIFTIKV